MDFWRQLFLRCIKKIRYWDNATIRYPKTFKGCSDLKIRIEG